jgi:PAS domain S-box-containing protein
MHTILQNILRNKGMTGGISVADLSGNIEPASICSDCILSLIIADSPITVFAFDDKRILALCTKQPGDLIGPTTEELIGKSIDDVCRMLQVQDADGVIAQVLSEEPGITLLHLPKVVLDIWHTPLHDEQGTFVGVVGIALEVTQRWQVEEKLREEQSLLENMLRLHECDRQLVAFEIHDGFVQDATAADMFLKSLLSSDNLPYGEVRDKVQKVDDLIKKAVEESRQLISGLRPTILEESGVIPAVSNLIDSMPPGKPTIGFTADVQFKRSEPLLEATLYRIVQHGINNIKRHSHADRAEIRLTQQGQWIHLEIEDWGIGFDPLNVSEDRFGLQGIRERARLMRGRAVIDSAPGKGTRIIVDLPVAYPLK